MGPEAFSRRGVLTLPNRLVMPERGVSELILPPTGLLQAKLTRREWGKSVALGSAIAASGGLIVPIDYNPGMGEQSFPWLPAREDLRHGFNNYDLADQAYEGDRASSIYRGQSTGAMIQDLSEYEMDNTPNGRFWVGRCLAAGIAALNTPILLGERQVFGITIPWRERLRVAVMYHTGCKIEIGWGQAVASGPYSQNVEERGLITPNEYGYILAINLQYRTDGTKKFFIANTSSARGFSGQEWWAAVRGFDGEYLILTDFKESSELGVEPMRKDFRKLHYTEVDRLVLVDPAQAHPGEITESQFNNYLNKPLAGAILDMAMIV